MKKEFTHHDNFHVKVSSAGTDHLKRALSFFFDSYQQAVGFSIGSTTIPSYGRDRQTVKMLILHWWDPNGDGSVRNPTFSKFPTPLEQDALAPMVQAWLESADYGKEPDQDGDNVCGFTVFNDDDWDKVQGDSSAICAIAPHWAMAGK